MCEILFRGKRIDNGEWVSSGNLITFNDEGEGKQFFIPQMNAKCICTHDEQDNIISFDSGMFYKVDPDTVGQYTGLTDKNGKKIFEGDILTPLDDESDFIVEFKNGCFNGVSYAIKGQMMEYGWDECAGGYGVVECEPLALCFPEKYHEVIGNIYDNPELLEVTVDG